MSDKNKGQDQVLDHNYDGIQEYNNPLPNWWLVTFYGTIIFSIFYFGYYSMGSGPSLAQELTVARQELEAMKPAPTQATGPESEDELAALMSKPESLAQGKEVFAAKCAACHLEAGQGLVGPNLTDNFWIHGKGTRQDILQVVRKGVVEKGMLAWETLLKPEEVIAVSGFVYSLKGTNPPNPKAPQGTEIKN